MRRRVSLTSFWIVSFTLIRLECGSVQMNPASTSLTLFKPFSFFKQIASNSLDSGCAIVQVAGGDKNRSQFLQKLREAANGRDQ